jgi:hypothetical protein
MPSIGRCPVNNRVRASSHLHVFLPLHPEGGEGRGEEVVLISDATIARDLLTNNTGRSNPFAHGFT